jgi:ubiquinone/menaquinone biosynthesis C-methylase UbiE
MKKSINSIFSRAAYVLLPRSLRKSVVKLMISAEEFAPPRDAIRWLLGIFDQVSNAIDLQSIRWGNGVHIKHELMDGIHSFFYDRIPKNAHVLDLGCGIGAVAHAIAAHTDAQVLGIDFDAAQIAFAKQRYRHPNINYVVGNVFTDIPDVESFDVIVLSSILEHLENREHFLNDLSRRFHPGKFLIRVPTFERHFFAALKRELGLFPYTDDTHVLEYSPQIFMDEMKASGLEVRHFEIRWGDIWSECVPLKKYDQKTV